MAKRRMNYLNAEQSFRLYDALREMGQDKIDEIGDANKLALLLTQKLGFLVKRTNLVRPMGNLNLHLPRSMAANKGGIMQYTWRRIHCLEREVDGICKSLGIERRFPPPEAGALNLRGDHCD